MLTELGYYLNLGYRIIVSSLVDEQVGLRRVVPSSRTKEAEAAKISLNYSFEKIIIPSAVNNYCVRVLNKRNHLATTYVIFPSPPLTPRQHWRINELRN